MDDVLNLGQKQRLFSKLIAQLILHIYDSGYEVTLGEAWRSPEQAALNASKGTGIKNSEHTKKLAIDLNLFKDGVFLKDTSSHKVFGDWWVTLHPLCRWGGNFTKPDGDHYSLIDVGIQ